MTDKEKLIALAEWLGDRYVVDDDKILVPAWLKRFDCNKKGEISRVYEVVGCKAGVIRYRRLGKKGGHNAEGRYQKTASAVVFEGAGLLRE